MNTRCPVLLLLYLVVSILASLASGLRHSIQATFQPEFIDSLKEGHNQTVFVLLSFESQSLKPDSLYVEPERPENAQVLNPNVSLLELEKAENSNATRYFNASFVVEGLFIGKTRLKLSLITQNGTAYPLNQSYSVWVLRGSRVLTAIFVSTLGTLIIIANVLMGCELNLETVKEVLKKPVAPSIGFVCQFAIMPLMAYCIGNILLVGNSSLGLGLFTAGCSPGGGASNFWTLLLNGNVDLSITMTFVSTLAALGMMPLWMWLLGNGFVVDHQGAQIHIPYKDIVMYLFMLVGPLFIGILIRKFRPNWAEKARKALRPFIIFIILFIMTFGVYANLYMFRLMSWQVLLSGLLLPWFGFAFGCGASLLTKQPRSNVTAIAVETGVQNSGIAIMLLKVSFLQPDADLASVVPVVVSMFTPIPLLAGYSVHSIIKCIKGEEKEPKKEVELEVKENHEVVKLEPEQSDKGVGVAV